MTEPPRMPAFKYTLNASALLAHGNCELRRDALAILDHVLDEVNPYTVCRRHIRVVRDALEIGDFRLPFPAAARMWFFGAGKASLLLAQAIEDELGGRLSGGLVICKEGQVGRLDRIDILHANHPIPSPASVAAAKEMVRRVALPRSGDIVICGITGGSSALMTLPADDLSLSDMQRMTEILLTCGANIFEINAVRKHLSVVGGGRLAQRLDPDVFLVNLAVSDVIGDALDYTCDPVVPDTSWVSDARATLDRFDLWPRIPEKIRAYLEPGGAVSETPKALPKPPRRDVVLISSSVPCTAALSKAEALGYDAAILSSSFDGESQALGEFFAAIAREIGARRQPLSPPCALIGGGETIVRMAWTQGAGGPNQEFALAGARRMASGPPSVLLGVDTDGSDGPTQVAGALCDSTTAKRAESLDVDIEAALRQHNVTPALLRLEDAVITGATGTNVNDLKVLLVR